MSNRKADKKKNLIRMICLVTAVIMVLTVLVATLLSNG